VSKLHQRSATSNAPSAAVWLLWSDPSTWPAWNPDVERVSFSPPFAVGRSFEMTTSAGRTHTMTISSVQEGRSFSLRTKVVPGTTFEFVCSVAPDQEGARVTQGVRVDGPLAWLFGPLTGPRVSAGFQPIVDALARHAEQTSDDAY
jgi:hypothetical protein